MKIISEGTVFESRPNTDAASACFPGVCVLPTGRWVASFRLAPAKSGRFGRSCVAWSDDQGRSWSDPVEVAGPLSIEGRLGCWRSLACTSLGGPRVLGTLCWEDVSEPFRPMFNPETEGLMDAKVFTAISEDQGAHFGSPVRVDCGPFNDRAVYITGPTVVFPDGTWGVQYEVYKHWDDRTPVPHVAAMSLSTDEGNTWSAHVEVHTDPEGRKIGWDQRHAVLPDGSLLAFFWTFSAVKSDYLTIHAKRSTDGGRTWSPFWDTGVPGQPARPVGFADGTICMVHVDRSAEPLITARLSDYGAKSFPDSTRLLVHERLKHSQIREKQRPQDAWAEMGAYSIGLPDATALADGDVLVVYYSGDHANQTDIRWARLAMS